MYKQKLQGIFENLLYKNYIRRPKYLYHGTHIENIENINTHGFRGSPQASEEDNEYGRVFFALEPDIAFGYAIKSSGGGENGFDVFTDKATHTNHIIIFKIQPDEELWKKMEWIDKSRGRGEVAFKGIVDSKYIVDEIKYTS